MVKKLLLLVSCCLLLTAVVFAQPKVVKLKGGNTLTGEVTKTDEGYRIEMKSGDKVSVVIVPLDTVVSVTDVPDPLKEYNDKKAAIDAKSPEAHCDLGEWCFRQGLLEQASIELKAALELRPEYAKATLLLKQVENAANKTPTTLYGTRPPTSGPTTNPKDDNKLLSDIEVYRIRVTELRREEMSSNPTIEFKNNLVERFLTAMSGRQEFKDPKVPDIFRGATRVEQAVRIIREFGDDDDQSWSDSIIVKTDTKFMVDFRGKILPVVIQFCGSLDCHGGEKGQGGFKLYPVRGEKTDYANFVILDGIRTSRGKLINRDRPLDSLLLQFGLPADIARMRHSDKAKVPPMFRDIKAQNYKITEDWIRTLRYPPHPDYRITWQPPVGKIESGRVDLPLTTQPVDKDN